MKRLASADNVVAKISGLGMVDWHWTVDSIRPFVRHTIDCFGTDRVMFGSNFPVDRLYSARLPRSMAPSRRSSPISAKASRTSCSAPMRSATTGSDEATTPHKEPTPWPDFDC